MVCFILITHDNTILFCSYFTVLVAAQNDQEGSGVGNLEQQPSDQEGSGAQIVQTDSSYDTTLYSESDFEPSIEEALLSSDLWALQDNFNNDNDIVFVEEPTGVIEEGTGVGDANTIPGDDEDYIAEISGNNPLEAAEEETNALSNLELGHARTIHITTASGLYGNEIEVVTVNAIIDSNVHIDGNALGNTGDGETVVNPVLQKYGGLSAVLLFVAAIGIGALISFLGFVMAKLKPCRKSVSDVP